MRVADVLIVYSTLCMLTVNSSVKFRSFDVCQKQQTLFVLLFSFEKQHVFITLVIYHCVFVAML